MLTKVATYLTQSARLCHEGVNWQWTLKILANYWHFYSYMDAEITALEQRKDKTIAIKQGMMQ